MPGYENFLLSAAQDIKHDGPAPTTAPVFIRGANVNKRQATTSSSTTFTVTQAPDSTCGFLSGSAGVAITCENKQTCLWETQYLGGIICGTNANAIGYNRCFPRETAINPVSCNDVCQSNTFNLLCTNTASPYCRTYNYPAGVRDYRCAATPVATPQSVLFTYRNQEDRTLTVSEVGGPVLGFIPSVAPATGPQTPSSLPTGPGPTTTTGRTTATTAPPTSPSPNGGPPTPPVGAIVGGVVGGLAVLGLFILGAYFLIHHSRKNRQGLNTTQVGAAAGGPPISQYAFGNQPNAAPSEPLSPGSPTSTYDPAFKGHGSISMASAVAPGDGMTQEQYGRASYAPPVHQQGAFPPQPQPPVVYHQPAVAPAYTVQPGLGQQGVYEIQTTPDQHRG